MPIEPTTGEPDGLAARIRALSLPMQPISTGESPRLAPLGAIRAVVFDIYGTLFISGSGDIGAHAATDSTAALAEALHAVGLHSDGETASRGVELLHLAITEAHIRRQGEGIDHPEVDIRAMWRRVLDGLAAERLLAFDETAVEAIVERLAVEYECRVNPVWPMPHLDPVLGELREWVRLGELALGIVSNAQFLTPLLFEALLGRPYASFGFDESICNFSYRRLEAKPSVRLYEPVAEALRGRGIAAGRVLYVGNDMRNDIWPASRVGFRTALFAGDRRSLRRREGDTELASVRPDAILTDLAQLPALLRGDGARNG